MSGKRLFAIVSIVLASGSSAFAAPSEVFDAYEHHDYATVLRVCEAPAKAGDSVCQDLLGMLYSAGEGVARDQATAFHWFELAAAQGNPTAEFNLALAYERGEGVARNMAEAEKWYTKSAEAGLPYAEFRLARLEVSRGDWKTAMKWLRPAAAQGLPPAQSLLGSAYEAGHGVRRSEKQAAKWYEAAADHGDRPAQSSLAGFYERGVGVEQDLKEAYFWYAVALRDPKSSTAKSDAEGLKRVAAKLNPDEVADAAQIAKDWKPEEAEIGPKTKSKRAAASARGPKLRATGTGFYIARDGSLITNDHVVEACSEIRVSDGANGIPVKVLALDPDRDLALLKAPGPVDTAALFRSDKSRLGENIVVVGFPLSGLLSSDPIVTAGIVSALAGMRDNQRELQISAPIQPGNSGGPVFDASGRIAGIAVGSLDTVQLARAIGVVPENINFAIKAEEARQFLAAHGVTVATAESGKELSTAAIAEQAVKMTVRLECWK